MMVSKVAVVALVAILAVPILLGYGMNLSEETVTSYKVSNDPNNVTQLLMNGTDYTRAFGNIYQLNTNFISDDFVDVPFFPRYNDHNVSHNTSFPFDMGISSDYNWSGETQNITYCHRYIASIRYNYSAGSYIEAKIYSGATLLHTIDHVIYIGYDEDTDTLDYIKMQSANNDWANSYTGENPTSVVYSSVGGQTASRFWSAEYNDNRRFTDFAGGFFFSGNMWRNHAWEIVLPDKTTSVLLTVDLDSISDSSYSIMIGGSVKLTKTTTGGAVSWTATDRYNTNTVDLYYDPNIAHNTYQILFEYPDNWRPASNPSYRDYYRPVQLRYVGDWPTFIGDANYYLTYDLSYWQLNVSSNYVDGISLGYQSTRTPTLRVDAATFIAMEYQVIEDKTYTPSSFKTNPSTKLTGLQQCGSQIVFGGHTYTVDSKNRTITLESHDIPIDGLVFNSVLNGSGTYDNKIGNTIVSTTATPSTITFNGKWVVNVITSSSEQFTYAHTEWTPGEFGWDGIDTNFLFVGLLTAIGVFIALGIAYRKAKSALWALLVVCGGAAVLFFTML